MFDDLSDLDKVDLSEIKNVDTSNGYTSGNKYQQAQTQNQSSGYQQRNQEQGGYNGGQYGNNQGGYNRNNNQQGAGQQRQGGGYGGGGGNNFKRKEEVIEEPYIPVALFVDRDFPPEIKNTLYNLASKLINKKITVRFNGDDKDFYDRLTALSDKYVEAFIPWRNFNNIENNKHYYNTLTSKHIAQLHFPAWDKIPDSVKALMARNVRMIFGDKNNSVSMCLITWSGDGASRASEVTKDTGRASFIIKTASHYGFPVVNVGKQNAEAILEKSFGI